MTEPSKTQASIGQALRAEFERGRIQALDPTNDEAVAGGPKVTTLSSRWLHRRCVTCGHTFRLGDEVEIAEDGKVHHRGRLVCHADQGTTNSGDQAARFFEGLDEAWPPPKGVPLIRLESGQPLLAPPLAAFRRHACAVCGHTLRPQDMVVVCPCSPNAPMCSVAIHRDPLHGLNCWEDWNPDGLRNDCPVTSRVIRG